MSHTDMCQQKGVLTYELSSVYTLDTETNDPTKKLKSLFTKVDNVEDVTCLSTMVQVRGLPPQ